MLASLDNQVVFKHAFTNKIVFERLIKDFYNIDITVNKIETEKKFLIKTAQVDITLDIYAETTDRRFVIEIQKIQYDYNFDRFLNYFITLLTEQQKTYKNYKIKKTVLGIAVLTRPYRFTKLTGEPILDNYMVIDFNPRDINDKLIKLNEHELKFINTNKKYNTNKLPSQIQDWINLFQRTIYKKESIKLNFNNKAIKKVSELINVDNIAPATLEKIKKESGRKKVLVLEYKAGKEKGIIQEKENSKKILKQAEEEKKQAEKEKKQAEAREKQAILKAEIYKLFFQGKSKEEISRNLEIKLSYVEQILTI